MAKTRVFALLGLIAGLACAPGARAEIDWLVDGLPASVTATFNADAFSLRDGGLSGWDETMSLFSSIPNVAAGTSIEIPGGGYADAKAGFGLFLNSRMRGWLVFADAEALYEAKRTIMVGPHLGAVFLLGPEWWGDGELDISDGAGFMAGLRATMGDKISYVFSVDYFHMVLDIDPIAPWTPSDDEIDLTGVAFQFGVRAQF